MTATIWRKIPHTVWSETQGDKGALARHEVTHIAPRSGYVERFERLLLEELDQVRAILVRVTM